MLSLTVHPGYIYIYSWKPNYWLNGHVQQFLNYAITLLLLTVNLRPHSRFLPQL